VWVPERFKKSTFEPSLVYNTIYGEDEGEFLEGKKKACGGGGGGNCVEAHFDPTVRQFKLEKGHQVRLFKTSDDVPDPESHTRAALATIMNELVTDLSNVGTSSQGIRKSPAFNKLHPKEQNNLLTNLNKIEDFEEASMDIDSNRKYLENALTSITRVNSFEPIQHIEKDHQSVTVKTERWKIHFFHAHRVDKTVFESIKAHEDSGRILWPQHDPFTVQLKYDTPLDNRVAELFKLDGFVAEKNILTIQSDYSHSRPGRNSKSPITKEDVEYLLRQAKGIQIIEKGG
jgi:hypothetical protein